MDARNIVEIINDEKLTTKERMEQINEFIKSVTDPKTLGMAYKDETALMAAASAGYSDCIQALVDAKVDIEARPKKCMLSAVQLAAYNGRAECIKLLIEAKAKLNEPNRDETSTLCFATGTIAKAGGEQKECVRFLLAAGAKLNLEYPNDRCLSVLYDILLECDPNDLSTKSAFQTLLHINDNEKERREKANIGKNAWISFRNTLDKEQLRTIEKILKKPEEIPNEKPWTFFPLNLLGFFSTKNTLEVKSKEPDRTRDLTM